MEKQVFTNEIILSWLQYYAGNTTIDLEHVKIIDITRKNKNVIPTVESHKTTLIFTNAGINDIFYRLWNAGLGECDVWYNEGSEPSGQIYNKKVKDMIDRGINASAGMLIVNPNARNTAKIGMGNDMFRKGSIHYVGSEIRAVILNKMMVDTQDDVCVIGGESIAIETALIAAEGTVVAVEYNGADRDTMEDNVDHFGLQNVTIIDRVDEESIYGGICKHGERIGIPDKVESTDPCCYIHLGFSGGSKCGSDFGEVWHWRCRYDTDRCITARKQSCL